MLHIEIHQQAVFKVITKIILDTERLPFPVRNAIPAVPVLVQVTGMARSGYPTTSTHLFIQQKPGI
jgi:hypothetical protein